MSTSSITAAAVYKNAKKMISGYPSFGCANIAQKMKPKQNTHVNNPRRSVKHQTIIPG